MGKMQFKDVLIANTAIFVSIAFVHLLRIILQTPANIGSFAVPMELSWAAVIVGSVMAWLNWHSIPKRTSKTWAQLILWIFIVDLVFVLGAWYFNASFLGFSGQGWLWPAVLDLVIIGAAWWYLKK